MFNQKCRICKHDLIETRLTCPKCGVVNVYGEGINNTIPTGDRSVALSDVEPADYNRFQTDLCDEIFGVTKNEDGSIKCQGIVRSSAVILGGAPGAGKTTLCLQICDKFANDGISETMYIGAEQSGPELRATGQRLKLRSMKRIRFVDAMNGGSLIQIINSRPIKPKLVVVDSLQALVGEDSDSQLEVCKAAKEFAVRLECPFLIISHVTKADVIAGKLTLQHAVDTTITFFPDESQPEFRIMQSMKNRFGRANIASLFIMTENGLIPAPDSEDDDEEESD